MHARAPPLLDIEAEMKLVLDSKETFGENLVSKKMKDFGLERLFSLLINFLGEKVIVGIVVKIQNWSFPCICKQQLMTVVTLFVFLPGLNVPSEVLTGLQPSIFTGDTERVVLQQQRHLVSVVLILV